LNSKKPIILLLTVSILALGIFALNMPLAYASPKSLYICADHHTAQFDAWNIKPDGTAEFQATISLSHATDPAGIAIDESSNTLFITSEFSRGVEMVDATTLTSIGVETTGPSNLAGIDVDDANDIVYTVKRNGRTLYAYDWDPIALTLTARNLAGSHPYTLPGCSNAYGIALDNTTNILWVADAGAGMVRAYDTTTWLEDTSKSFAPSHHPVDVDIDKKRGLVYTVGGWYGSYLLSKYDLATSTETAVNINRTGCGLAVDEVTGLVYVTSLNLDDLSVWDCSTASFNAIQATGDIGTPAGLCIPEEAAFNPLSLAKDDGLAGACVNPGATITYAISFNNTNPYAVGNVLLWDNMSSHVTFVDATGGGGGYPWSYDLATHSVIWNIGNLSTASPDFVTLTVMVNPGTPPSTIIINFATIQPITMIGGETTVNIETEVCPEGFVIPEVPMGTIMASAAMIIALIAYVAKPKWKRKPI